MNRVDGKVALVSGATRGIGAACARLLARAGATVVATGRQEALGRELVAQIARDGGRADFMPLDVTAEADWVRAIDDIVDRHGGLHILVNNAGVFLQQKLEAMTLEEWRGIATTNLDGVFLGTRHGIRAMRATGFPDGVTGSIVNMSSISALVGMAFSTAYSMTKGGVRAFTRSAALECADLRYPIRVNGVYPTFIETDMADEVMAGYTRLSHTGDEERVRKTLAQMHPLRRFGDPIDVAKAVLFLASDDSGYMTGAELVIDGGFTAR